MPTKSENFVATFNAVMGELGMPVPQSLFGTFTSACASAIALHKAYALGGSKSLVNILKSIAVGGSAAIEGAEIGTALGGVLAASYVGAVTGAIIVAAWDTWGPGAIGRLYAFTREMEKTYGQGIHFVLQDMMMSNPYSVGSGTMMLAIQRARAMTPVPKGRGASGSW